MKETTLKTKERFLDLARNYSLKLLFFKAMCFIAGIFVSKGSIFGHYHPFGLSFSGAAMGRFFAPITIGAAFGYLFPLRMATSIRYIASLVTIATIRWTLSDLKRVKESSFYTPILVFVSSLITGIAVNCAGNFESSILVVSVVESFIAALAAYFFDKSYKIFAGKTNYELSYKDLVYVSISMSLILFSLEDVMFGSVSLGRVLAISVVLIASYLWGTIGGSLFGISMSVVFGMSSLGFTYLSGVYSFGGMISGICSGMGRVALSGIFLLIQVLFSIQSGNTVKMISGLYECVFAVIIFLSVPKSIFKNIKCRVRVCNAIVGRDNFAEAVIQKLNFASKFLVGVPKVIAKSSTNVRKNFRDDLKNECEMCVSKICCACEERGYCYGCYKNDTAHNLRNAVENALMGQFGEKDVFSKNFALRCRKSDVILNSLNDIYKLRLVEETADSKISCLKNAAGQQLCAVSSLLDNISHEIGNGDFLDEQLISRIKSELLREEIEAVNIICRRDKAQRLFIEVELPNRFRNSVDKKFFDMLSNVCGKQLSKPVIMGLGESFRVQICEKTKYKTEFFVAQHNCNNGKVCGDSCRAFEDGNGNFNVILSDGMGTGVSAAEEGSITAEMMKNFVKAGMGFDCSVRLVNSSLIMNSKEEMLSTLDVVSINLFSGKTKFMKAGAPFTYVLSGQELRKIDISSLPIGIFTDVTVSMQERKLREGDWIIMLSDGVTDIGEEWLEEILKSEKFISAEELANAIVDTAVHIRKSTHDDDITAIVMRIIKNKN